MPEDTIILFIAELVLINVLIRSILNTKVLQGSVSTRLRCFYDQFITQSLLSPRVKNWKSVNICRSCGQLSAGSFFMKHGVYLVSNAFFSKLTKNIAYCCTLYCEQYTLENNSALTIKCVFSLTAWIDSHEDLTTCCSHSDAAASAAVPVLYKVQSYRYCCPPRN